MSEITKLYENVEVKKQIPRVCSSNELYCKECEAHIEDAMPYCKNAEYPPFTAEKQREIVKMILFSTWWMNLKRLEFSEKFDEGLAQMINELWQDLTNAERTQIKEILE